jgi:nitroimidazol reductase NimA-like FMN-containing flavoprotein (pyridoxamine 5'-phosphate oxidase superfamily)
VSEQPVAGAAASEAVFERLDETECLRLIAPGGIGRLAYTGSYDLTVLPVNYVLDDGAILLRTEEEGLTTADLRTGDRVSEYRVAFEVDEFDRQAREGWSVLIQGPAHHLDDDAERATAVATGLQPWAPGVRDHFIRITPLRVTGRRVRRAAG